MLAAARAANEPELVAFFTEVLEVYEKYNINGHIAWKR